jgi:hypothetical protein
MQKIDSEAHKEYFELHHHHHYHRRLRRLSRMKPLGLSRFRIYFSDIYESIWTGGRTPWTGDQPDSRPLFTQDNTAQKNADTHPCLEWDSNPRSQCSSGRRQYVPQTSRPLEPATLIFWIEIVFLNVVKMSLNLAHVF